jgi:glutamate--cysteine ligase
MDPWLINPMYARCGEVNFSDGSGAECLMSNAETLLGKIRRKYKEYGIQEKPFIIVKADAGTYGMGIMTVRDPKDLADLNRRSRNKMSVIKDGQEVSEVILQEGVPTYERVNESVAEPVVYMIDRYVVGGFYRVNPERGNDENLNSPGGELRAAGLRRLEPAAKPGTKPGVSAPNRFYMYGVIGRLRWSPRPTSSRRPTRTPRSTIADGPGGRPRRACCEAQ